MKNKKQASEQKILALILAGGMGGRLGLLTENRAKPVVPFAGFYRLIDFALSNCMHSRISDVWVIEQYELHTLNEHLSNGRPWDLDRTYGGLQVLPPFENRNESKTEGGFSNGNADAIVRHQSFIQEFNPDILVVLSADHIYKFDFRRAIRTHLEKDAALTMVTTKVPKNESASRFGVVKIDADGRVTDFQYKPDKPMSDLITTEIFVYDAKILFKKLKEFADENKDLKDYGNELIPYFVENKLAFEHRQNGYWRDVGTIKSYWNANMDLLDEKNKIAIDDEDWRILTLAEQRIPALVYSSANVRNSLISHGCKIKGTVNHSVLSAGVTIEKGAEVSDSIILPNVVIEEGVKLEKTIVDAGVIVTKDKLKKLKALRQKNKNDIIVVGKYKIQAESELAEK